MVEPIRFDGVLDGEKNLLADARLAFISSFYFQAFDVWQRVEVDYEQRPKLLFGDELGCCREHYPEVIVSWIAQQISSDPLRIVS